MSFFGRDTRPRKIEVDPTTLTSDSDEVRSRLDRIGANYERVSEILAEMETQIATDERLKAINESIDEAALEFAKERTSKNRKRRPRKPTGPNKPR